MRHIIISLWSLLISLTAFSQAIITGRVVDEKNGQPLEYAVISRGDQSRAVITDKDGRFQISVPKNETTVFISLIGYHSQSVPCPPIVKPLLIRLERGAGFKGCNHYPPIQQCFLPYNQWHRPKSKTDKFGTGFITTGSRFVPW